MEIHPETPPEGTPLTTLFPRADVEGMTQRLNAMGAPFGLNFQKIVRISNSRLALAAAEYAREHGRFDQFHRAVFHAYFTGGKDIGSMEVLTRTGREAGLDDGAMADALRSGKYAPRLLQMKQEAVRAGVTAVPAFIINDRETIVGAQSIETFRKALRAA